MKPTDMDLYHAHKAIEIVDDRRKNHMIRVDIYAFEVAMEAMIAERERAVKLVEAIEGVVRVADRKTIEFDTARTALAEWRKETGVE